MFILAAPHTVVACPPRGCIRVALGGGRTERRIHGRLAVPVAPVQRAFIGERAEIPLAYTKPSLAHDSSQRQH